MRKLILLEDCPDLIDDEDMQGVLVALTPRACYLLSRCHRPYHVPSDFASETELSRLEDSYWEEQLAWFDQFDDLLWQEIPELKEREIRAACLYGYFLKLCLDILFIRGFEITALLKGGYERIVLWRREVAEPPVDSTLQFHGPSVYSMLLPLFCRRMGVVCQERLIPASSALSGPRTRAAILGFPVTKAVLYKARQALFGLEQLRWAALRAVIPTPRGPTARESHLTLLLTTAKYDLGHLLKSARRAGHRCLLFDRHRVIDVTGPFGRVLGSLGDGTAGTRGLQGKLTSANWEKAAERIASLDSPIWRWPDGWYDVSLSRVLAPRLKYWVAHVLQHLATQTDQCARILRDERVDFVVAPHIADLSTCAAVVAAHVNHFTWTVHIEHGDSLLALKVWDLLNLFHFNHYFVPHRELAEYFQERRGSYVRPTAEVHVGSYRWHLNSQLTKRPRIYLERSGFSVKLNVNSPPGKISPLRPIVVYLVTGMGGDTRYLNSAWYPDAWYYRLQTHIVDSFVGKDQYTFVVKLFPGDGDVVGPIGDYVRALEVKNIHASQAPFVQWLPWANRVIIDFPSTGLYEAALAGVPFHLLLHANLKVRSAGLEKFRPWMTLFTQPEEAVRAVDRFLQAEVEHEPRMQVEGDDILRTLESLASKRFRTRPQPHGPRR